MRATASEINSVRMAEEALKGLSGDRAINAIYSILCDHPRITTDQLEYLSNRLGRAAHERGRHMK